MCGAPVAGQPRHQSGQGTSYRRGSTWTAKWTVDSVDPETGKIVRTRKTRGGFATQGEADQFAAAQSSQGDSDRIDMTLSDLWSWYESARLDRLSHDRQTANRIAWRRIVAAGISSVPIRSLRIDTLQAAVDDQAGSYYTARDMRDLLSKLCKRGVALGAADANIAPGIDLPTLQAREILPFTMEEVQTLWNAYRAGDGFIGYILLLIYSGMMPGELFNCKIAMIDYDKHEIKGCGLKTDRRRDDPIYFPEFMEPVIKRLAGESKSRVGKLLPMHPDTFRAKFAETLAALGIRPLKPYSCRHTTATALADAGVHPATIQMVMRHATYSTTSKYIHPGNDAARSAVNLLKGDRSDAPQTV